mgnify:CR=1 FL=1
MLNITLKGGTVRQFEPGTTVLDVAKSLGGGLYKQVTCGMVDGEVVDLRYPLQKDCELILCTFEDEAGKKAFWHTATHIMAQAVKRLYPETKLAIGPAIDGGFYYDFDRKPAFSPEDLEKIEAEMQKIVKEALPIERLPCRWTRLWS